MFRVILLKVMSSTIPPHRRLVVRSAYAVVDDHVPDAAGDLAAHSDSVTAVEIAVRHVDVHTWSGDTAAVLVLSALDGEAVIGNIGVYVAHFYVA